MDYLVPAILFALGFGGALLARRAVSWIQGGRAGSRMPMDRGSVRLEDMGRKRKKRKNR